MNAFPNTGVNRYFKDDSWPVRVTGPALEDIKAICDNTDSTQQITPCPTKPWVRADTYVPKVIQLPETEPSEEYAFELGQAAFELFLTRSFITIDMEVATAEGVTSQAIENLRALVDGEPGVILATGLPEHASLAALDRQQAIQATIIELGMPACLVENVSQYSAMPEVQTPVLAGSV